MQTRISSCAVLMSFCLAGPALAEKAQSIFIEGDMVRGNTPKGPDRADLRAEQPVQA